MGGKQFAAVTVSESKPCARLDLQFHLAGSECAIEASGGALDIMGFIEDSSSGKKMANVDKPVETTPQLGSTASAPSTVSKPQKVSQPAVTKPQAVSTEQSKEATPPAPKLQDFIPSAKFIGAKSGMVFKRGPKVQGYYKDTYVPPARGSTLASAGQKRKAEEQPSSAPPAKKVTTLTGGLKFETLQTGAASAPQARRGRYVQVRYEGRLASNGKRFDKGSINFKLGAGRVIKGWDLGVEGMRVKERRKLFIPAPLAYGSQGAPPDIPRNAALVFDVELLKVN